MATPVIVVDTFNPVPNPVPGATQPTVTLTVPYQDPPNTFRAMTVTDMYTLSFVTSVAEITGSVLPTGSVTASTTLPTPAPPTQSVVSNFNMVYEVGIPASIPPRYVSITNLCVANDLQVQLQLPQYLVTEAPPTFSVSAASVFNFTASFSEDVAKTMSLTSTGDFKTDILVTIYPLNVTGPVFVGIALPPAPPVTPPPPPPTVPPVPNPQDPFGSGAGGGDVLGTALPPVVPGANHARPGITTIIPGSNNTPAIQQ